MKRTILTLTIVLATSICSQSFGFDLLDRMLGMKGCGTSTSCCEAPGYDNTICEPACGFESSACGHNSCEPACGAESHRGSLFNCGLRGEPACGCESICEPACSSGHCEPACGAEIACGDTQCCAPRKRCGNGLLGKLFSKKHHSSCCEAPISCEPACGLGNNNCCESAGCDSGCFNGKRAGGMLSKLFSNLSCKKNNCCDVGCDSYGSDCGCGTTAAPYAAPAAAPQYEQSAPMPPAPIVDPSASISRNRRVIQASASYAR